ncbi:hypothetical protein BH11PSE7_BH11PSE7_22310 [soil metagenome]
MNVQRLHCTLLDRPGTRVQPIELRQFRHEEDVARDDVDLWINVKRPGSAFVASPGVRRRG